MKLLVWAFSLCLIGNGVSGLFFDGLTQFFGGSNEETTMKPVSSTDPTTKDILDEMEIAADNLDGVWQRFKKELLNFVSENDAETNTTQTVSTTGNSVILKPNTNTKATTVMLKQTSATNINIESTTMEELPSSTPPP